MITPTRAQCVLGVVVTYYPDLQRLQRLILELVCQVDSVLIVDNTPGEADGIKHLISDLQAVHAKVESERFGFNRGIAAAQNVGIRKAMVEGFGYVLLSDQDSLPLPGMVAQLHAVAVEIESREGRVGCICPAYIDGVTNAANYFQVQKGGRFWYSALPGDDAVPWIELLTCIASGSLIPVSTLDEVGMMREDYFIDFVDTEWCHRARHHGYRLYGTALAQMQHRLGDGHFRVWFWRWKSFNRYSPLRLRYRFRNAVLLLASSYVSWRWKARSAWTWLGDAYAHVVFAPGHFRNLVAIAQGIIDGIAGRGGAIR